MNLIIIIKLKLEKIMAGFWWDYFQQTCLKGDKSI